MTSGLTPKRISGWIRLIPGDGFGIPLFISDDSNVEFIPETDNVLRIVAFHEFDNADGYNLDRSLSGLMVTQTYAVGDGAPIPFVSGGVFGIANGSESSSAFLASYGSEPDNLVIQAIAGILVKAETGTFEKESLERGARDFEDRHAAVFTGGPVHSRYWVEQYEHAALDLLDNKSSAQKVMLEKLKQVGSEWLGRFSTSGDPQILVRFLEVAERNHLVTTAEIKTIYYVVMASLISKGDFKSLLHADIRSQAERRIPEGLYYYELTKRGVLQANGDLAFSSSIDLVSEMKWILRDGEKRLDFNNALRVANLLFGREQLPPVVYDTADTIALHLVESIEVDTQSNRTRASKIVRDRAISRYHALEGIRRVMDWQERSTITPVALGLSINAEWVIHEWIGQLPQPHED